MTPRTFTLEMPAGERLLSLNDRVHWSKRARVTRDLRTTAGWLAKAAKIPPLDRVSIVAEYQPPRNGRRDPDNLMPAVKAAIDGCVNAKIIPDDSSVHVTSVTCAIGEPYPRGRLVLRITEVPQSAAAPVQPGEGRPGAAVSTTTPGGES